MYVLLNTLLIVTILLFASQYAFGLTCYSCADCGDPFDVTSASNITVNGTNLYCKKTQGASIIDRNITDICEPFTVGGNGVQCCQTDFCNGVTHIFSSNSLIFIFLIGSISKFI
ncbi:unnamed protein product [Adineta ricciae]|uniref:Uncharacterized protein n=1 Tax=Adineta ricciae TaxID=249248 RepID=A0A815PGC7_ADIRI|nr:unnamed protein product [Adineta ricciae]